MKYLIVVSVTLATLALLLGVALMFKGRRQVVGNTPPDDGDGWFTEYKKHLRSILLLVVAAVAVYWGYNTQITVKDVVDWGQKHWFIVLVVWTVVIAVVAIKKWSSILQWISTGVLLMLFVVLPFIGWVNEPPKPATGAIPSTSQRAVDDCTGSRPCPLSINEDGHSVAVAVPEGKVACFDPSIWKRLNEVGLMISYRNPQGGESFPCSRDQVYAGQCTAVYDRFWFKPPSRTVLPNYWFVESGSKQC